MLYKLNINKENMTLHIIRDIDNTIWHVQFKSQHFQTTEELFSAMKSYLDELPPLTSSAPRNKKVEKTDRNREQS